MGCGIWRQALNYLLPRLELFTPIMDLAPPEPASSAGPACRRSSDLVSEAWRQLPSLQSGLGKKASMWTFYSR